MLRLIWNEDQPELNYQKCLLDFLIQLLLGGNAKV
jgi:hypothetical protein